MWRRIVAVLGVLEHGHGFERDVCRIVCLCVRPGHRSEHVERRSPGDQRSADRRLQLRHPLHLDRLDDSLIAGEG
jgi:hypothetical protein